MNKTRRDVVIPFPFVLVFSRHADAVIVIGRRREGQVGDIDVAGCDDVSLAVVDVVRRRGDVAVEAAEFREGGGREE